MSARQEEGLRGPQRAPGTRACVRLYGHFHAPWQDHRHAQPRPRGRRSASPGGQEGPSARTPAPDTRPRTAPVPRDEVARGDNSNSRHADLGKGMRPCNHLNWLPVQRMGAGSQHGAALGRGGSTDARLCPKPRRTQIGFHPQNVFCRSLLINKTLPNCDEFHNGNSTAADLQASRV